MNPLGSFYSGIFQYAYVCQDVEQAAAGFKTRFGTGDFDFKLGLTVDDVVVGVGLFRLGRRTSSRKSRADS